MFELSPTLANDTVLIGNFSLSRVLLMNDSNYPWFILVPRQNDIQEIYQLERSKQEQLLHESSVLAGVIMEYFDGDKLNIAAIGNIVPQLHLHHIVRYKNDIAWPKPVWGLHQSVEYETPKLKLIKKEIIALLTDEINFQPC